MLSADCSRHSGAGRSLGQWLLCLLEEPQLPRGHQRILLPTPRASSRPRRFQLLMPDCTAIYSLNQAGNDSHPLRPALPLSWPGQSASTPCHQDAFHIPSHSPGSCSSSLSYHGDSHPAAEPSLKPSDPTALLHPCLSLRCHVQGPGGGQSLLIQAMLPPDVSHCKCLANLFLQPRMPFPLPPRTPPGSCLMPKAHTGHAQLCWAASTRRPSAAQGSGPGTEQALQGPIRSSMQCVLRTVVCGPCPRWTGQTGLYSCSLPSRCRRRDHKETRLGLQLGLREGALA